MTRGRARSSLARSAPSLYGPRPVRDPPPAAEAAVAARGTASLLARRNGLTGGAPETKREERGSSTRPRTVVEGEEMTEPEPKRTPPTAAQVRAALLAFADLVRRLDEDDRLLRTLPLVMGRLGDLRHMLFEYEVRVTERLLPTDDPVERESRRIVREARERDQDAPDEWEE